VSFENDLDFCEGCGKPFDPIEGCLNCPDEQDDLKYIPGRVGDLEAE
jgi:hypothetical protein